MRETVGQDGHERVRRIREVVDAIESEMRLLTLWDEQPPTQQAMASRMPFCYDTLGLLQWLQWIFLPRMRLILEQGAALPTTSDIWPLAEEEFRLQGQDTTRLLELIRSIDRLISDRPD